MLLLLLQMEGPGGIADSDVVCLTLQPAHGLKMLARPRAWPY
jgi:hypothetical protein